VRVDSQEGERESAEACKFLPRTEHKSLQNCNAAILNPKHELLCGLVRVSPLFKLPAEK
jgi:hypothetical protein